MGYATLGGTTNLAINSPMQTNILLTNVATTRNLQDISIPIFQGNLVRADLTLSVQQLIDSSGALNRLNGAQSIRISPDAGANWYTAITLPSVCSYVTANSYFQPGFIYPGAIDIKQYISSGGTLKVQWLDGKALGNSIEALCIYTTLNLYLSGG